MDERLRIILEAQNRATAAFRQMAEQTRGMGQNLRSVQTTAAQMSSSSRASLAGLNTSLRASAVGAGTASRSISTSLGGISLAAGRAVSAMRALPGVIAHAAAAASRARGPALEWLPALPVSWAAWGRARQRSGSGSAAWR
jgi:hypothetical protein